ncbi:hypothetical protein Cgig2_023919 [Carnegiea gigantea]|uniref:Peptidase S54 rhomboid domain-containing protein n=1 Tax=Carnegiea gigantea TaxID=171969 RepID=A0A9Q1JQB8_9CARY|nr:hypothetical protein Cgig2_023919 [Carnegiea gigantea]
MLQEISNFLWGLETYMEVMSIENEASVSTRLNQWWEGIPFITSAVVIVCATIYLVCLLFGYDSFAEICFLPSAILSHFQAKSWMFAIRLSKDSRIDNCCRHFLAGIFSSFLIYFSCAVYRIFTSILFHGSFLHVFFNMLALVPLGSELERIMGSVRLLYTMVLLATSSAVLHLLIALLVAYNPFHPYPYLMNECAIGFSGILFSMIAIETSLSGVQSRRYTWVIQPFNTWNFLLFWDREFIMACK